MIIGLDPGASGAIAAIDPERNGALLWVEDLPVLDGEIMGYELSMLLRQVVEGTTIIVEQQQAIGKRVYNRATGKTSTTTSASGAFALGVNYGACLAILTAHRLKVVKVPPPKWKPLFGLSTDKERSVALAKALWPMAVLTGPRGGLKDGRAEALLLAEYGRRKGL